MQKEENFKEYYFERIKMECVKGKMDFNDRHLQIREL